VRNTPAVGDEKSMDQAMMNVFRWHGIVVVAEVLVFAVGTYSTTFQKKVPDAFLLLLQLLLPKCNDPCCIRLKMQVAFVDY
jgi:hypothetical protein